MILTMGAPMQNDAKLGLVAGVAGVVVAGILFAQPPQPSPHQPTRVKTAVVSPKPAGTTSASLPVGKPEPVAVPVSRKTDPDD
jgi:hypothetical protein